MSGLQGKRKRQDLALAVSASLTNEERIVYNIIRAKKDMGIWSGDIKREMNLPETMLKKSLKLLQSKSLIKEVVNIRNKSRKLFMAAEFEPSNEITGGEWYSEGKLDSEFITHLTSVCLKSIFQLQVATCDGILEWTRKTRIFPVEVTKQQVEQILRILVMDDKILEVKSTGFGDFASIHDARVCYRLKSKGGVIDGAMLVGFVLG